jgi:spermidine synthase
VVDSSERFDTIVVDAYSSHVAIPAHLVTIEFWRSLRPRLAPGGVVLANLVLEPSLQGRFATNLLATIQRGLGQCAIAVLEPQASRSNVELVCRPSPGDVAPAEIYSDDRNPVERDRRLAGS